MAVLVGAAESRAIGDVTGRPWVWLDNGERGEVHGQRVRRRAQFAVGRRSASFGCMVVVFVVRELERRTVRSALLTADDHAGTAGRKVRLACEGKAGGI